jgi:hypothetical protein
MEDALPHDIQYFWFLDNNVFRVLCSSPDGAAIKCLMVLFVSIHDLRTADQALLNCRLSPC